MWSSLVKINEVIQEQQRALGEVALRAPRFQPIWLLPAFFPVLRTPRHGRIPFPCVVQLATVHIDFILHFLRFGSLRKCFRYSSILGDDLCSL